MLILWLTLAMSWALDLDQRPGNNETRIYSAPFVPVVGETLTGQHLEERLAQLDYQLVDKDPQPGQYVKLGGILWIHRREHRLGGRRIPARRFGLLLARDTVLGGVNAHGKQAPLGRMGRWLEPTLLGESFEQDRAVRTRVVLEALPDHVWQPLLALEDSRFFDHVGVDAKALLRAAVRNAKAGRPVEGGSTLTQQLIKNRDLSPRRTLTRKASEAVRALALEAAWSKEQILQSYLNTVYYGHVDGIGIYGIGAAARVYFDKDAEALTLPEAATLAAVVQGPNALSPLRHPDAATERRDRALTRMVELGWLSEEAGAAAIATPLTPHGTAPERPGARHLRAHLRSQAEDEAPGRVQAQRGIVAWTTVDPWLQTHTEDVVTAHLARLRREYPLLAKLDLTAAVVALDAETGEVLAHVGGDPADSADALDRVTRAWRQPGSLVKPFVIAEALQRCGSEYPLHAATWVSDDPLTVDVDGVPWTPRNYDRKTRGAAMVRDVLVDSLNVPVVRIADHCGWQAVAQRVERAGLPLEHPIAPAFVLGAVEETPWDLAGAYASFEANGKRVVPHAYSALRVPGGRSLDREHTRRRRAMSNRTAHLVRQLLVDVVEDGTGKAARIDGWEVAGKSGTSSNLRDAWFVAMGNGVVVVAWVGLDGAGRVGLTGGAGAAPLVREVLAEAVRQRPEQEHDVPALTRVLKVDPKTGYVVPPAEDGVVMHFHPLFYPGKKYFWRKKRPEALGEGIGTIEATAVQ